jgi:hypothetical protein
VTQHNDDLGAINDVNANYELQRLFLGSAHLFLTFFHLYGERIYNWPYGLDARDHRAQ